VKAWLEFAAAVAGISVLLWLLWHDTTDWLHGRSHETCTDSWPPSLLVHVTPDGEILEFPTSWDWPAGEVAQLVGEIEALPEVVA
jgi:hypothetical protein